MSIAHCLLSCCLVLALGLCGCNSEEAPQPPKDNVRLLPELPQQTVNAKQVSKRVVSPPRVQFQPGERFHYVKSIDQRLSFPTATAAQHEVEESIKLVLALTVEQVLEDRSLLSVQFYAAQYAYDMGDKEIRYYSGNRGEEVPLEAKPYAGLVGNGFSIWISHDNHLVDVVGFEMFLQKCLQTYPADQRLELLQQIGGILDGPDLRLTTVRSFLDESIALLPFDTLAKKEPFFPTGATWDLSLNASQPLRTQQQMQMKLEHVDHQTAHVIISGTLLPLAEPGAILENGLRVTLSGGQISGSCSIDLRTGMPQSSRILREFDLQMISLNRAPLQVRKTVETRLDPWNPGQATH